MLQFTFCRLGKWKSFGIEGVVFFLFLRHGFLCVFSRVGDRFESAWMESFREIVGCSARMRMSERDDDTTDDFLA